MHRFTGRGGSGDQRTIHPDTRGVLQTPGHRIHPASEMQGSDSELFRDGAFGKIGIKTEYAAALSRQQLAGEQADQPQTADHEGFTKVGISQADALQTDRGQNRESRCSIMDCVRDDGTEVLGHRHQLCMVTVGGHPITHLEARYAGTNRHHGAHVAIAKGQRLMRTASNVVNTPSVRAFSNTCCTLSGCWRALSIQLALPKSTSIRSVPEDNKEQLVRIRSWPRCSDGEG